MGRVVGSNGLFNAVTSFPVSSKDSDCVSSLCSRAAAVRLHPSIPIKEIFAIVTVRMLGFAYVARPSPQLFM
jgi:hypothetical protein